MADGSGTVSPWEPITDTQKLKLLGKLIEECNELAGICARCIIQGIDERNPSDDKSNRQHLENEIADVQSKVGCVMYYLDLDQDAIRARALKKTVFHMPWFGAKK